MTQPIARVEIVHDTYFGTTIADPYRWMEEWTSGEAMAWITAQGEYTRHYLDALPDRAALLARIAALDDVIPRLSNLQIAGGRIFYLRRDPDDESSKLIMQRSLDTAEQILVDPNRRQEDVPTAIDWYFPSQDGSLVVYGLSQGGSENSTLYVLDVERGTPLDLAISRVQFGQTDFGRPIVQWLDNSTFVYNRLADRSADASPDERYTDSRIFVHHVGSDPEHDMAILGRGINDRVNLVASDIPILAISSTSDWMIGMIVHGVAREVTLYAAPRDALDDPSTIPWTSIADVADGITDFAWIGDTIYLKTHKDAPRYKVVATSLEHPDLTTATVVVPPSQAVIEDIRIAGDYLLTKDLDGGIHRLRRVRREGGKPERVPLPFDGTISEVVNEVNGSTILLHMESWIVSPRIFQYDTSAGTMEDTHLRPPSSIDMSMIETHEVFAPSKDGTLIPLSILHPQELPLNGNNPTVLLAYGSYGVSLNPFFWPVLLAWFERGFAIAIAHVRGGGEYGKEWHLAGQKLNKQNTIDDFIACAEHLIRQSYTRSERLAGMGMSAGGIPSGGALVQRPDLWGLMFMGVPLTNMLRSELQAAGPANILEFGSVTTEEGFQSLLAMDSYMQIREGVAYPAVMITTGLNDPRVVAWHAIKMAARLQSATTSSKPVLLRVEIQGGHGLGATKSQEHEELADQLAFMLDQFEI